MDVLYANRVRLFVHIKTTKNLPCNARFSLTLVLLRSVHLSALESLKSAFTGTL